VYLSDTLSGRPVSATDPGLNRSEAAALACKKLLPWEKVIRGYTPEECARIIADECSLPDSLIWHAWKGMPDFYSDQLKLKLKNPKSVNFAPAPAAQQDTAPDGATEPADAGEQTTQEGGHTFSPPPHVEDVADGDANEDVYNLAAMKAAQEKFRSQSQGSANANPQGGGSKPPSRR
jgi:hypothetical protein